MAESKQHLDLELTSYLDGELESQARARVESHLLECAECSALLGELREVVSAAHALEDRRPEADLWPGIEQRIGVTVAPDSTRGAAASIAPVASRPPLRVHRIVPRFSFSLPQLAAAALFVALLSGGAVWWTVRTALHSPAGAPGTLAVSPPAAGDASTADFEIQHYDQAVADLQRVLNDNHDRLDPETVKTVEANLAIIDAAIAQARKALIADPANPYLSGHLADQMKRKIRVLQRTADAVSADYSGGAS